MFTDSEAELTRFLTSGEGLGLKDCEPLLCLSENEGVILLGSASKCVCFGSGDDGERLLSAEEEDKDDSLPSGLRV